MPTDNQRRIRELFDDASDLPAAERMAWLNSQKEEDPQVLLAVGKLLQAASKDLDFLSKPALRRHEIVEREGRRIGPYKVLRELGAGGMGVVYLAVRDDDVFQRLAAIKVIRENLASGSLVERFRKERRTLASLDHPNIARILDGGTTEDGLPYFVMDFIDGEPIDEFCNKRRATLVQRLNLTGQICEAVEYLHTHHVLHRDLKPANILVTGSGMVKVLDFGIAKELDENFQASATSLPMMTPNYASPEQVLSRPAGPQLDVYSLGAILYLLLTGRRPLDLEDKTLPEVVRIVTEQEPLPVSVAVVSPTLQDGSFALPVSVPVWKGELEGDLDRIVAMALRKEPERRYSTAAALAADIRRFQQDEPVAARGNSFAYTAFKFVRRNRIQAIAASIVFASLAVAGVAAGKMYYWYREVSELRQEVAMGQHTLEEMRKASAQISPHDAEAIKGQVIHMERNYRQQVAPMLGSPLAPRHEIAKLAGDGVSYLNEAAPDAVQQPETAKAIGNAYLAISQLQWQEKGASLQDPQAAETTARSALLALAPALANAETRRAIAGLIGQIETQAASAEGAVH